MTWGSFSTTHMATLLLAVVFNIVVYFMLKKNRRSVQILTLFALSLFGAGILLNNILTNPSDWLKQLPLNFWGLNIVLLPIAVFTRGKRICNLLLIWSASSMMALVFNSAMENVDILSMNFVMYFTMHMLGCGIPILLFELNLVKRDTRTVKSTLITTIGVYTIVHGTNIVINSVNQWSALHGVNYMSSLAPSSPISYFFYAIIPAEYWYMILALPLLLIYIGYWYLPEILDQRKRRKPLRSKLKDIDSYYDEYEDEYIDEIIDKKYHW